MARRPRQLPGEQHALVGRLMDAQILCDYAEQAMHAASCPENSAAVDVALDALGRLRRLFFEEAGRLEGVTA